MNYCSSEQCFKNIIIIQINILPNYRNYKTKTGVNNTLTLKRCKVEQQMFMVKNESV